MFQDFALFPHLRVAENVAFGLQRPRPARPRAARGRAAGRGQHERPTRAAIRTRSRAASSSGWRWPGRWRPRRELMLLDEAFSASTPRCARRCARRRWPCCARPARRRCWSPTTPRRRSGSATASTPCSPAGSCRAARPAELYAGPVNALRRRLLRPGEPVSRAGSQGGLGARPWAGRSASGLADGRRGRGDRAARRRSRCAGRRRRRACARGSLVRRDLGPVHVLRLGLPDGSSVKVRQTGETEAVVGDEVEIELDPRHLFVYPAAGLTRARVALPGYFCDKPRGWRWPGPAAGRLGSGG